jgi:hypothetical protein
MNRSRFFETARTSGLRPDARCRMPVWQHRAWSSTWSGTKRVSIPARSFSRGPSCHSIRWSAETGSKFAAKHLAEVIALISEKSSCSAVNGRTRIHCLRTGRTVPHDAPPIGERAATRGRLAAEGGDEHAGVRRSGIRSSSSSANRATRQRPPPQRPRRTTRPGTRTLVDDMPPDVRAHTGGDTWARHRWTSDQGGWMSVSRPHSGAFIARHDPPLIGERAATRGRSAMEGGDEYAAVKSLYPCECQLYQFRHHPLRKAHRLRGLDDRCASAPVRLPRRQRLRRSSANARQRASASQRNAAMGTPLLKTALSVLAPASRTGSRGGNLDQLPATRSSGCTRGPLRRRQRCAVHRRTRRNA